VTHEEHRQRHVELHRALNELLADYLRHTLLVVGLEEGVAHLPSVCTVAMLTEWSHHQTIDPFPYGDEEEPTPAPGALVEVCSCVRPYHADGFLPIAAGLDIGFEYRIPVTQISGHSAWKHCPKCNGSGRPQKP
jgi:hypothetical protein